MARKHRIVLPDYPHHVIVRGNNRRRLFSFAGDYEQFLYFVGAASRRNVCGIQAVTLMTNHAHLIITPTRSEALSAMVKAFSQRYAQYRNRERDGTGKLFEERFLSFPILSEFQLAVTTVYVHMNPVRAGLVRDAVDYRWSTDRFHKASRLASPVPRSLWTPSNWFESLGRTDDERARAYHACEVDFRARSVVPERVDEIRVFEAASLPYGRRLLRPNGLSAREREVDYEYPKQANEIADNEGQILTPLEQPVDAVSKPRHNR